jgi:hypothetical protein
VGEMFPPEVPVGSYNYDLTGQHNPRCLLGQSTLCLFFDEWCVVVKSGCGWRALEPPELNMPSFCKSEKPGRRASLMAALEQPNKARLPNINVVGI